MNLYSAFFPILTHLWGLKADDAHQENSHVDLYCWEFSLISVRRLKKEPNWRKEIGHKV